MERIDKGITKQTYRLYRFLEEVVNNSPPESLIVVISASEKSLTTLKYRLIRTKWKDSIRELLGKSTVNINSLREA